VLLFALTVPRRLQRWGAVLALAAVVATVAFTLPMLGGAQPLVFFDTYAADDVAVWSKLVVLGVTALAIGLSAGWFRTDARQGEYYALLLLSALGAILLAGSADVMELVLAVLLSSTTGYLLCAYHRASARSVEAGMKYFLLGAVTNSGLLYGVMLLFGLGGTTTLVGLRAGLSGAGTLSMVAATALVMLGLAFKLGAVPAHAWVPDVADGAPAPVAAFVTTAPKVAALVAVGRLVLALPDDAVGWRGLVALMAAATMTLGNLAALWQDDVRRLLGWSAVSQTGYGLMAVVALGRSDLAVSALLFFVVAYSLANLAAFGVVIELRGAARLDAYRGLGRDHPWLAATLLVALLSLVGIPPLPGFTAKLTLFSAVIDAGYGWLAVLAVANTVVSLVYYLRLLGPAYLEASPAPLPALGQTAAAATLVDAAALVLLSVAPGPLLDWFASARLLPG
ncbi:MAG: NADH-quinone oxidoreductase subunit N, partial [Acidimicrobiales bacterium]